MKKSLRKLALFYFNIFSFTLYFKQHKNVYSQQRLLYKLCVLAEDFAPEKRYKVLHIFNLRGV
jgi:hypothetical protein